MASDQTTEPREVDSYSDGMCGWVKWERGEMTAKIHWNVYAKNGITSQSKARDEAKRLLA